MKKPEGFEEYLSEYTTVAYDSYCGEPITEGFFIVRHMPEEKFNQLYNLGDVEYITNQWALITKKLTPQEAVKKYGDVKAIGVGPRGGFKTVTYGEETFIVRQLDPRKVLDNLPIPKVI